MRACSVWVVVVVVVVTACGPTKVEPESTAIRTTHAVLAGVSMGAIGTSQLAFSNPQRFDAVGMLGGPLDAAFFFRMLDDFTLGGFCPLEDVQRLVAEGSINDPAKVDACRRRVKPIAWEHDQHFNHWRFTTSGSAFNRSLYLDLITDLTLGFGSLFHEAPGAPFAPPNVPVDLVRDATRASICTSPIVVRGLFNAEYNPRGETPAITFCDGQPEVWFCRPSETVVDFCSDARNVTTPLPIAQERAFANAFCQARGEGEAVRATRDTAPLMLLNHAGATDRCREAPTPVKVLLAFDFNGNGRRDYGEPVLNNGKERFDDVGTDGCANALEDGQGGCLTSPVSGQGDANGDDYDADTNPNGTENDWLRQPGEPFKDFGLDGVPGTNDVGEGNGTWDVSLGRRSMLANDARSRWKALSSRERARLDVLVDGGIRDVFNLGVMARQFFGAVRASRDASRNVGAYRDFAEIPGMRDKKGAYAPWNQSWPRAPRDLAVYYGKDQPTDDDRVEGEGDHVGNGLQAVQRFFTLFNFAAATWPALPKPAAPPGSGIEREVVEWFDSKTLGAKREYGIVLPPGYELPENAEARYPVLVVLHGYGQEARDLSAITLISNAFTTDSDVRLRPMIQVFPSGRCCFTHESGARDCREHDDQGRNFETLPGWKRGCVTGSFFVNSHGYDGRDALPYADAVLELMDHVNRTYRTLPTEDLEAR